VPTRLSARRLRERLGQLLDLTTAQHYLRGWRPVANGTLVVHELNASATEVATLAARGALEHLDGQRTKGIVYRCGRCGRTVIVYSVANWTALWEGDTWMRHQGWAATQRWGWACRSCKRQRQPPA
jgi:hypothetical protein